jgi:hypothetical protein
MLNNRIALMSQGKEGCHQSGVLISLKDVDNATLAPGTVLTILHTVPSVAGVFGNLPIASASPSVITPSHLTIEVART